MCINNFQPDDKCSPEEFEILGYRVELRNASGVIVNQTEIASGCGVCMDDQCPTPFCSTSFDYDENYSISVTAFNSFESSPPAIFRETIGDFYKTIVEYVTTSYLKVIL